MEDHRTELKPEAGAESPGGKTTNLRRFLLDVLETVLLSLVLFLGINAISARIRVESISMQPTLYAGNFIVVNKLAYLLGTPGRGDIIIFRYPPDPEHEPPYIKRVIGLPGDEVRIENGKVYVNEIPLSEPYISAPPRYEDRWTVPEDALFVLGDNRNASSDSHSWGMVPMENVIGKAEVVYWPPDAWRVLNGQTAAAAAP
jgi:signal peptidase I